MANESARALVLPVSILVAVTVGVVIGTTLARPAIPPSLAPRDEVAVSDLNAKLSALTNELERVRQSASTLSASSSQPTRIEAPSISDGKTARQIEEATLALTAALEQMRVTAASFHAERRPLVVPSAPPDRALLEKFAGQDESAVGSKYLLWTYQQVLDRFGAPSSAGKWEAGMYWMYRLPADGSVSFMFVDGLVVSMYW